MMFDNLFSSKKDERIEELESKLQEKKGKVEQIEKELEKEKKRAKEAITEKQKTDKKLKDNKTELKSLKDKIRRLEEEKENVEYKKKVKDLSKNSYYSFLKMMTPLELDHEGVITQYSNNKAEIKSEQVISKIQNIDSTTGFVHLSTDLDVFDFIITPPFPIEDYYHVGKKFNLEQLKRQISDKLKIEVLDLHAGKSTVGTMQGKNFEDFEKISTNIKSKHSKGGFSQGRFERNRKKQIEEHVDKIIEKMDVPSENMDYILLTGNDRMISMLKEKTNFECPIVERALNLSDVKNSSKENYSEKIFGARLYIL